ncbi:Uncharacterised protein [Neisseria animaloris]|uniref:Uncharacterized protein n=1 Tax=Neisseria animaloris TaxID=326522 RepID=A0A448UD21_9NEIS|nr:Uncharacterised protein [Neisseria animaloris]VEJ21778.1 Uncharacterised protein [Neisseria animaloris]
MSINHLRFLDRYRGIKFAGCMAQCFGLSEEEKAV